MPQNDETRMMPVICALECTEWTDRDSLFTSLLSQMTLPPYFGKNLDALKDVLEEKPYSITLTDASVPMRHMPQYFQRFLMVLADTGALHAVIL